MEKFVIFVKKEIEDKHAKYKTYCKVRDHYHYTGEYSGAAHIICNLKYNLAKEIPIVFRNGSNYDFHFIIKELTERFENQFTSIGQKY